MAYVISGRLFLVNSNSTPTNTAWFPMAGLNAVLATLNFPSVSSPGSLTVKFELANDQAVVTSLGSVSAGTPAANTPFGADSRNVSGNPPIGAIWCRLALTIASGSCEVIIDANTYSF